ncbi:MAG: hypothetical protein JWQ57_180 [Mucilaginibacter sp.]|nr:hypothetical protein [Mucilaginibacter sp.]
MVVVNINIILKTHYINLTLHRGEKTPLQSIF